MKLSASSVRHKSELGAVVLSLVSGADVRAAFRKLAALTDTHGGAIRAERMAYGGVELIVAAHTEGIVPALVIGLGGTWTEVLDDVRVIPLPAGAERIEQELLLLRSAPLLLGARGGRPVDLARVAELAERVEELLAGGWLELIECNPVLAAPEQIVVLDASARRAPGGLSADELAEQNEASCPT